MERWACPICATKLAPLERGRRKLLACPKGEGVFLTPEETTRAIPVGPLARLHESMRTATPSQRACSQCGLRMRVATLARRDGPVEVDACPSCGGVWLDAGELERINAKERANGSATAVAPRRSMAFAAGGAASFDPSTLAYLFEGLVGLLDAN